MSILRVATIEPEGATTTLTLGASGDTVTSSADSLKANTIKDAGGNTLFTSDGSGTLSSVNSALKGGLNFISSQTASGSASIEFTTGIDSTYDEYWFIMTKINPATDTTELQFQVSTDGGSNYNTNITSTAFNAYHQENDGEQSLGYKEEWDQADGTSYQDIIKDQGNGSDECGDGILKLFNPSSTTFVKNWSSENNHYHKDDASGNDYFAGYFNTTSAVNAISFKMASGNFDGTIAMYGHN